MTEYKAIEIARKQAEKWFKSSGWAKALENYEPSKGKNKGIERARKQAEKEFNNSFWKKAIDIKSKE